MTVLKNTKMIDVAIVPHPFAVERVQHKINSGKTISQIINNLQPLSDFKKNAHVYLNGDYIPQDKWSGVRPKSGTIITIRMVPMGGGGGGGKSPLRTVLSLAVMAGTSYLSGGLAGFFGNSTFLGISAAKIAVGGVNLLGRLALNAIAPPPKPRFSANKESATLFIQGAKNQAMPFGRVPKVLGKHRFVPPFGALPYTETLGNDQYMRLLFVWGYGPLTISDLKIGETPIAEFSDVEIETRQGYDTDVPITLYSNSVLQNDMQVSLTSAAGYITRTTEANADEISIDITLPRGLVKFDSRGNKTTTYVSIEVQYAVTGSGAWINAEATSPAIQITAKQSAAIRRGLRFKVAKGQYDVRVKRVTADSIDTNTFDETLWTSLRTIRYAAPINMQGLAVTALRIKATDQLNGVIDRFNGVVNSILPDWNGSAWVEQVTSNPASIFRHVLQGSSNARPLADSRLDINKIESWHDNCAANNREYNAVIDYNVSVREVLHDVASSGRASPSLIDGKWAVIEDKQQLVPIQHFTPRNTFAFKGEKAFDDLPHGLRLRFINRNKGWIQDERLVFDDGYSATNATKYETLELIGVTDPDQAWRDGRYHLATARLRPETYSFNVDIEHIVCTRGDLIRFTHDVPMFGLMSGRVKSLITSGANITDIVFDAAMPMAAGKNYSMRFRKSDGSSLVVFVVTNAGDQTTLTLTTPLSISTGPEVGDLALFGETGQESAELIVKSIEPKSDLNAKITCVAYDNNILNADSGTIPPFVSYVDVPKEMQAIPTPILDQVQSGLESVIKHADGSITSRIVITLVPSIVLSSGLKIEASIKASGESNFYPAVILSRSSHSISITDIIEGETYDIKIRYVGERGRSSAVLAINNHRVAGTSALPSDITSFDMNLLGSTAYLSWNSIGDIDLSHYVLRFAPQILNVTWGSATDIISKIAKDSTSISVPAAIGTYLLKAVDIGGRESKHEISVISNIAGAANYNVVANLIEDADFFGAKTGLAVSGADLVLNGADFTDDWLDIDLVSNVDIGESGVVSTGTYSFNNSLDLGGVYISRLTADMNVLGINLYNIVDSYIDVDLQASWDQVIDPSLFDVKLQLRTTDNDPAANPTWSVWKNFVVGDYSARAYQFQALLTSLSANVTPAVSKLQVNIDMPDRIDAHNNLTALAAGSNIIFVNAFKAIPAISITAENMQTGDYYTITNKATTGFTIEFFNSINAGVSRVFDYMAKGYGG